MARTRKKSSSNSDAQTIPGLTTVKTKRGFYDKQVLNLFLISQFGIDVFAEHTKAGTRKRIRPFRVLTENLIHTQEGLADDGLHHFYHALCGSNFFVLDRLLFPPGKLLQYEQNIVECTNKINASRDTPIAWKYYQWLTLLFVEIYLDRYFSSPEQLLNELNEFVARFNKYQKQQEHEELIIELYSLEDLNKICLQNATGSGKTLLMAANYYQYRHYERLYRRENSDTGLTYLLTPNERLSAQDAAEFSQSGVYCVPFDKEQAKMENAIYSLEVQKLAETDGVKSVAASTMGNQNLLFIDEGHAGLSKKDKQGTWYRFRSLLCERGFSFEYSATFKQAVEGTPWENEYARAILFDYSYRWFYEDGYGKDYQIFNLPESPDTKKLDESLLDLYLTGGLLKFYQQLYLYSEHTQELKPYNIEKPLWVWVGHTVGGKTNEDKTALSDVARIVKFLAMFLKHPDQAAASIHKLLTQKGYETGLMDDKENDLFNGAFFFLEILKSALENDCNNLYSRILADLFNSPCRGGHLVLERIKGDSGEILLKTSNSETPFGLINVSGAAELCNALKSNPELAELIEVNDDSADDKPKFESVKHSTSPINILIGAKKFIEGWDCWRVSILGMLNVGKTEGTQVIQLFGRGVRLKGYNWTLKRSSALHEAIGNSPNYLKELELLCVFGVCADAMVSFKNYLKSEDLPGNEQSRMITIDMDVCQLDNKKLKILAPKRRKDNGREYNFKTDGPVPAVTDKIPKIIEKNAIVLDWYPRIQSMVSGGGNATLSSLPGGKNSVPCLKDQMGYLDFNDLYFCVERWKRNNAKYNLNCSVSGLKDLFRSENWFELYIPVDKLHPRSWQDVQELQIIARTLLEKYLKRLYDQSSNAYMLPRLEYRILDATNDNIPKKEEQQYQIIYDLSDGSLEKSLQEIRDALRSREPLVREEYSIKAIRFIDHLYNPLLYTEHPKVKILPCSLNQSEFTFVKNLKKYAEDNAALLKQTWGEIYLLRNQSRGRGFGFFEANNFYPDFILWCVQNEKQYITFIEPHGLKMEGAGSAKVQFCNNNSEDSIKNIEKRLKDSNVILNCFILSCTRFGELEWGVPQDELEKRHILFMDSDNYISRLFQNIN